MAAATALSSRDCGARPSTMGAARKRESSLDVILHGRSSHERRRRARSDFILANKGK
jgi:hypothetical protein